MNKQEFELLLQTLIKSISTLDYDYSLSTVISILEESFEQITYHYKFPEATVAKQFFKGNKNELVINFYDYFTDRDLFLIGRKTEDFTVRVVTNGGVEDDKAENIDCYISSGTELTGLIMWLIGEL